MDERELPAVARSATWVAAMRVAETARADRLFEDPYARRFVSPVDEAALAAMPTGTVEFVALRTRFFDDCAGVAAEAGVRQFVLLGAGLDTRAYRLVWPTGARLFELDLPETLGYKEGVLAEVGAVARCERVAVGADLRDGWAALLTASGFDPSVPTGWLAEGLLPYFDRAGAQELLAAVTRLSAPGSHAVLDHIESGADERPGVKTTTDVIAGMGARLRTGEGSPPEWLAGHGWRTRTVRVPALGESYGRPLPAEVDPVSANAIAIITATR